MSRVSVIIPAFQASQTIERAISSVQQQTYNDWEIIVIDDGSVDATADIIQKLARSESRVHYYYQHNQGPAAARNAGANFACGEYLAFLDADDEWKPGKLLEQVQILDNNPEVGLTLCDSVNFDKNQNIEIPYSRQHEKTLKSLQMHRIPSAINAYLIVDSELRQVLHRANFINTSTVVIRRELFNTIGRFNEVCRGTEDHDLWVRLASVTTFGYLLTVYALRYKGGSNVSARSEKWLTELIRFHRMYLAKEDYKDLHDISRSHLQSTYRSLLRWYGRNRNLRRALAAFRDSLDLGFDLRSLLYLLVSLLGPVPFIIGGKFSQLQSRLWRTLR